MERWKSNKHGIQYVLSCSCVYLSDDLAPGIESVFFLFLIFFLFILFVYILLLTFFFCPHTYQTFIFRMSSYFFALVLLVFRSANVFNGDLSTWNVKNVIQTTNSKFFLFHFILESSHPYFRFRFLLDSLC